MQHAFLCTRRTAVKVLDATLARRFSSPIAPQVNPSPYNGRPPKSSHSNARTMGKNRHDHEESRGVDIVNRATTNARRVDPQSDANHNAQKRIEKMPTMNGFREPFGVFALPFSTNIDALINELPASSSFPDPSANLADYADVSDVLDVALPYVVKNTEEPRVFHPTTPHGLLRKMIKITTFKPLPSFSRLLKYHDAYPALQSTKSFNYLIQHAIRHTNYTTAHKLLQRMAQSGLPFDTETQVLRVRLFVRTGKGIVALKMIEGDISNGLEVSPELWIELMGYAQAGRQRNGGVNGKQAEVNLPEDGSMEWKKRLLDSLSKTCLLIEDARVLDRFTFLAVQHLLREGESDAAQDLTMRWLAKLPPRLNKTRAQRCLNVLHLHPAHSEMGVKAHIVTRRLIKELLELCPSIKPNSSTLFLLLRSLKRSCVNGTTAALSSVQAFQGKWGSAMVDRRVRRRVVAIALKEGKIGVAKRYLALEDRLAKAHDSEALVRQVTGVQQPKNPATSKKLPMRRYMVGQETENRKWVWLRRRYALVQTRQSGAGVEGGDRS